MSIPSRPAARHTSVRSPVGSAAASSSSRRDCAGRASTRPRKLSSTRPGKAPGNPNPPASSADAAARGNSSSASGLPCVSATSCSRTRASTGPVSTASSSARASRSGRPSTLSSGSLAKSLSTTRVPNTRPTDSAPKRRATNASACVEAWSIHCASSTRHSAGRSTAASARRPRTASPTRNRSGAGPELMPNAVRKASRWGSGRPLRRSSNGAQS